MKKVLIYSNTVVWDVSTEELASNAFVSLVRFLNEEWEVYGEIDGTHKILLEKALKGDSYSALKLLSSRLNYEYESWQIVKVENCQAPNVNLTEDFIKLFERY